MVTAVIFDFYGTLAEWADRDQVGYSAVFSAHGYRLDPADLNAYFIRYDGIEHREHSASEEAYESWARNRLRSDPVLWGGRGLRGSDHRSPAGIRRWANGRLPEAASTLRSLRQSGIAVGVCSNWGWELDGYLHQVGLLGLVDAAVTSARAGARKPHPSIYALAATSLGVHPSEALFVGDSW